MKRAPTIADIEAARAQLAALTSTKPRSERAAKARERLTEILHQRLREEIRTRKRKERA